jgi:hypothetical protein
MLEGRPYLKIHLLPIDCTHCSAWFNDVEMDGIEVGVGGVMGGARNGRFEFVKVR